MAKRLTERDKAKIVADYLECESYNAAAKMNGVACSTAQRVVAECKEIERKLKQKKDDDAQDILAYMESKRQTVCEIIEKGLNVLNDEEKLKEATPSQITTALGTLIDKFTAAAKVQGETMEMDALTKSLMEEAEKLNNGTE